MNKSIAISFLAALIFAACTSTPKSYIVEGIVPDESYNNQSVYLFDIENQEIKDTTLVIDGKFTFIGTMDSAAVYMLVLNKFNVNFILENGKISVDMSYRISAKGTPLNDELLKYYEALYEALNTTKEEIDVYAKFFNANKNNILGAIVLSDWSSILKSDLFFSLYEQSGYEVRRYLRKDYNTKKKVLQTAEGMPFTDFTIENGNLDGSKASLSDYVGKGKYVLVDFWASWCGPCIAEIPVLLEVYNKYKGDKFEVLGVAVWDKREESLKSIEKQNIPWSQIIDAGDIPTNLYGINSIPQIILFAPDGTIVARDLRGDFLKAKVAEVMQ